MSCDHPLARATAAAHPQTDAIEASEREGRALDVQVAALADLEPPISAETALALSALAKAILRAAGREGGADAVMNWARTQVHAVAAQLRRLGHDPAALDVRVPHQPGPADERALGPDGDELSARGARVAAMFAAWRRW